MRLHALLLSAMLSVQPPPLQAQSDVPYGKAGGNCDVYAPPGLPEEARIPEGQKLPKGQSGMISCWKGGQEPG